VALGDGLKLVEIGVAANLSPMEYRGAVKRRKPP
jgi:hypothetical protein